MPRAPPGRLRLPSSNTEPVAMRTRRSSQLDSIGPFLLRSDREGEGFRTLARLPFGGVLQGFHRPRLIEVKDGIELLLQPRLEVVAHALGFGAVDHPDGPLEPGIAQGVADCAIRTPGEQEASGEGGMEQRLAATRQGRPDALALGHSSPVGGGSDRSVMCGEADQDGIAAVFLAHQLTYDKLAALAHLGCARVPQVRIMRPDDDLRGPVLPPEMRRQRIERLDHVTVTQVP